MKCCILGTDNALILGIAREVYHRLGNDSTRQEEATIFVLRMGWGLCRWLGRKSMSQERRMGQKSTTCHGQV